MMKTNYAPYLIVTILLGLAIFIFRPIPISKEKDCLVIKGIVSGIFEGGVHDVVFALKDQVKHFYVNRGIEYGLDINKLRNDLIGKEIVIKYPDYWLLKFPGNIMIHASKVEYNDSTLYTEVD